MLSRQSARETHIQVRSLSGPAEHARLRKHEWNALLFYVLFLVELLCLSSFAGAPKPDPGVGLFLRSPAPVLPSSVSNQLNKGWTHLSVAIAFDRICRTDGLDPKIEGYLRDRSAPEKSPF